MAACLEAERVTRDPRWRADAHSAFDWFLGLNHLDRWLYDPSLSAFPSSAMIAAEEAWDAAVANPALYAPNADREGGGPYPDDDVTDEFLGRRRLARSRLGG